MPKRKAFTTSVVSSSEISVTKKTKKAKQTSPTSRPVLLNYHYSSQGGNINQGLQTSLNRLFDSIRDQPDSKEDDDQWTIAGTMNYLSSLGTSPEVPVVYALSDLLSSPELGAVTRTGFVDGWISASTSASQLDSIAAQGKHVQKLQTQMGSDPTYFKQVYKATFKYAKPAAARAVPVSEVFDFWDMFFESGAPGSVKWDRGGNCNWYQLWKSFYQTKVNRPVNKDLWGQVVELVQRTMDTKSESYGSGNMEGLGWWSEDGAWPTAIDEFVEFVRDKRKAEANGAMDTS